METLLCRTFINQNLTHRIDLVGLLKFYCACCILARMNLDSNSQPHVPHILSAQPICILLFCVPSCGVIHLILSAFSTIQLITTNSYLIYVLNHVIYILEKFIFSRSFTTSSLAQFINFSKCENVKKKTPIKTSTENLFFFYFPSKLFISFWFIGF